MDKETTISKRRVYVHILILVFIASFFWSFSRYPSLLRERERAHKGILTNMRFGNITKQELLRPDPKRHGFIGALDTATKVTLNWARGNMQGMAFGIAFGGAVLAFLLPLTKRKKYLSVGGVKGSALGAIVGAPLGVCTNCAAPIGLGMKRAGMSLESSIAAMFSSPTLNVVGLFITFSIFPLQLAITKILATIFLILLVIPLVSRRFKEKEDKDREAGEKEIASPEESWTEATKIALVTTLYQIGKMFVLTVPLMIVTAILGGLMVAVFPLKNLVIETTRNQFPFIVLASAVGTFLPMPILVDTILVMGLLEAGLPLGIAGALLVTLPIYSIYPAMIIGKYFSRKLAIMLFIAVMATGTAVGTVLAEGEEIHARGTVFSNIIQTSGILPARLSKGASFADYNNDDYLDLFITGVFDSKLYRNNRDGSFTDVTEAAGIAWGHETRVGVFGDYDNDGCEDLYISVTGAQDILYHNNCKGGFVDVSKSTRIKDDSRGAGAAWGDYNKDGYLDLYVTNYGLPPTYKSEPNILYENNGNGTFTDVTEKAGVLGVERCVDPKFQNTDIKQHWKKQNPLLGKKNSFQPVWFDYNNDGWPDLYVSHDGGISILYHNSGDGTFKDITEKAGLCVEVAGMGIAVGDYDQDGDEDLYLTNTGPNYLWRNNGDGTFTDVAQAVNATPSWAVGWGAHFFDYDNDQDLDLYVVNGGLEEMPKSYTMVDRLYNNNGDGTFLQVAYKEGIVGDKHKLPGAFGDYNNDGFIDVFVIHDRKDFVIHPYSLYKNKGNENNWLTIQLIGTKSNRDAVGAKVRVTAGGKSETQRVMSGSSFHSQNSLWQTFGLSSHLKADALEVVWPSNLVQTFKNVKANQRIVITEGSEEWIGKNY